MLARLAAAGVTIALVLIAVPSSAAPIREVPQPGPDCWGGQNGPLTGSEYWRAAAALAGDPVVYGTVNGQPYNAHISQLVAAGNAGHMVWPDGGTWTWICRG